MDADYLLRARAKADEVADENLYGDAVRAFQAAYQAGRAEAAAAAHETGRREGRMEATRVGPVPTCPGCSDGEARGYAKGVEAAAKWLEKTGQGLLLSTADALRAALIPTPPPQAAGPLSEAIRAMPAQLAKEFLAIDEEAELPYHLREDSPPLLVCSHCGRKSWGEDTAGGRCGMRQPNGYLCAGWWRRP